MGMNLTTLVIAEHDNKALSMDTLRTIRAATTIRDNSETLVPITVVVMGDGCDLVAKQLLTIDAVSDVVCVDSKSYKSPLAENYAQTVVNLCHDEAHKSYSHILAPASSFGKNLLPRVAALLDVGLVSDVISIESEDVAVRPIYAGNALARVKVLDPIKVMTIRGSAYDAIDLCDNSDSQNTEHHAEVIQYQDFLTSELSELVSLQKTVTERPELPAARVVVSGGRGLGSKDNFNLVEQLADRLGGAIGASRAAVDAGYVSNDLQVGQTGKIVAPELYIAVGISGAIQHLAGMKDSKVIVAINSDPEAPIFDIADYGLVGDLFEIMPELIDKC
ncbi:Electron transfer flavoprotein subunit alpha [Vibrio tapetis subsp. tapetis]|uniref:Electron transfer flavoprotein subunit alpha n=2 Tax=Vibrio tapetis TaxID=52443 RepID=A0A2N8ZM96_9VIBR|nr:Electron transfer flavoprotein subunit alpha [Vibrio tapetis subsp. tapetis]